MIRELGRRLRGAWHFLLCGRAPTPPPKDGVWVSATELRDAAANCFYLIGLPSDWPASATSEQMETLGLALKAARLARECDWDQIAELLAVEA